MNIENDALKLRKQYQCVMKGWVDLRNLVVTKEAYGKVLLQKLQKFEEELDLLYPEHNDNVNVIYHSKIIIRNVSQHPNRLCKKQRKFS